MLRTGLRPMHPGELLREDILPASSITQTELAKRLGVSRRTVNEVIHERRPVTSDMAHRLSRVFGTTPDFWMNLQQSVDLWEALETNKKEYARLKPLTKNVA
jgi:addiction module HigA family antidote